MMTFRSMLLVSLGVMTTTIAPKAAAAISQQVSGTSTTASGPLPTAYVTENRSIVSSGITRTFLLAKPQPAAAGRLPLVFSLHGDGGNAASARGSIPLEAQANGAAVFVYPDAPGGTFEYYTDIGRSREGVFVQDVIALLDSEGLIAPDKVFVTGFSGGATMANALGCRLGRAVLLGLGIHSGSLYSVGPPLDCEPPLPNLPAGIVIWGKADTSGGTVYGTDGLYTRDQHLAAQQCGATTAAGADAPCVAYQGCQRNVSWCAIDGLGHSPWASAAPAIWHFFNALLPAGTPSEDAIFQSSFESSFLYVPQYATASVRVYQNDGTGYIFSHSVTLAAGVQPNAIAFAPDGKLWVLDNSQKKLLRYSRASFAAAGAASAEVNITVGAAAGDVFDLAFHDTSVYVSQSNFGATNRVLRYAISDLAASGSPAAINTYTSNLNVPAGVAFDALGKLWINNYGSNKLVRINTASGTAEWIGSTAGTPNSRNSLNQPEGIAFDAHDTLWVGNNGEPTISGYSSLQLAGSGSFAPVPLYQIDINPALFAGGTVGGLGFDPRGRLWANYEKTLTVLQYVLVATESSPGVVSAYQHTSATPLAAATTDPGFGGMAIFPVPATLHR
ncbi:MAG: hypothetical protein ABI411_14755 [Tahibacter sp.]